MNRWGRRNQQHNNSWLFRYCPPFFYLNCSCHTCITWASPGLLPTRWGLLQLRTGGAGRQRWELLPWLLTAPNQDCALLQIAPLTFNYFFFFCLKYEPGDTQVFMTVEREGVNHILCLLRCWALSHPQRAGSSMDVPSARLLWIHPGLPEEYHQGRRKQSAL